MIGRLGMTEHAICVESRVSKVFLISPANMSGERARQLTSPRAKFDAARMYQSPEGVPIALAFAFMSALYFRGKIAYALQFAEPEDCKVRRSKTMGSSIMFRLFSVNLSRLNSRKRNAGLYP